MTFVDFGKIHLKILDYGFFSYFKFLMVLGRFGEILENKESQVCDLISDIRRYDSANRQLQDELFNLQNKFNGLASENAERQSAQFSRIRELETELQKANQQLKVRDLEFEALATEHESVNRLLTLNEQMVSALSQQPVKTAAEQA